MKYKFLLILSFSFLLSAVVHAGRQAWDIIPEIHDMVKANEEFVRKFQSDPVTIYKDLKQRARTAKSRGEATFKFPEMKAVVEKILVYLDWEASTGLKEKFQAGRITFVQEMNFKARIASLKYSIGKILDAGIPYHDFIRTSLKALHLVDDLVRILEPNYTGRYHEQLAKHVVERLLSRWDKLFLFLTFQPIDEEYFLDTRTVPVHLLGGLVRPEFADQYWLTPTEFAYHDAGHIEFMEFKDFALRMEAGEKEEEQIELFEANKIRLKTARMKLSIVNPSLSRAVTQVLFEIIHERGFQYHWPQLLPELQTSKWVEVIKRKLANHFWKDPPIQEQDIPLLDEARLWLLHKVESFMSAQVTEARYRYQNGELWTVDILPDTKLYHGRVLQLELRSAHHDQISVATRVIETETEARIPIFSMSLAQNSALDPSPLTEDMQKKISVALALKSAGHRSWKFGSETLVGDLENISISQDLGIRAKIVDSGKPVQWRNLSEFVPPELPVGTAVGEIDTVALFKMNQILKIQTDQKTAEFSHTDPVERVQGFPVSIEEISGNSSKEKALVFSVKSDPPRSAFLNLARLFIRDHGKKTETSGTISAKKREFEKYLSKIQYHDWKFFMGNLSADKLYMQPKFVAFDSYDSKISTQHGRKWFLSEFSTENEVIQTALLSALVSAEHQARKNFLYFGKRLYGPHFNINKLVNSLEGLSPEPSQKRSFEDMKQIFSEIQFPDAQFIIGRMTKDEAAGFYVQVVYKNPSVALTETTGLEIEGREFFIPESTTDSKILQQTLLALLDAARLEVQKNFLVNGKPIYSPDFQCASALMKLCEEDGALDRRPPMKEGTKG